MSRDGLDDHEHRFALGQGGVALKLVVVAVLFVVAAPTTALVLGLWPGTGRSLSEIGDRIAVAPVALLSVTGIVVVLVRVFRAVRRPRPTLVIAPSGLSLVPRGGPPCQVPWSEIAGLGIGYRYNKYWYVSRTTPRTDDWAVEVFLANPDAACRYPLLTAYRRVGAPPPRPGLPRQRYLIDLGHLSPDGVEEAIVWTRPHAWAGRYERGKGV